MTGFYPAYRWGGGPIEAHPYYIATGTAIEKGEIVKFTVGTGVAAIGDADQDDPYLGVAAEAHDGSTTGRQSGTEILIYDDPNLVFWTIPKHLSTTTGGDATSWIDSSLVGANDVFNGGFIVIVSTNSITGFSVGDILEITDYAYSTGDATVTGAGGTIASGMTGYIFPGNRSATYYAFDLDSDGMTIDFDTSGGECIEIVDVQRDNQKSEAKVFIKLRLHQLGNGPAAIA